MEVRLLYVLDKNSNAINWYKVSPEDGTYTVYQRRKYEKQKKY